MKNFFLGIVLCFMCLVSSTSAFAGELVHFNFGFFPAGFMISPNAHGFKAENSSSSYYYDYYESEEIKGAGLYTPGAFIGLDIDTNNSGVGFDVFGNYIYSNAVTGYLAGGNVSYIFPHPENSIFTARIKGGFVHGSLNWEGKLTDVTFDDANGWQAGIAFDVGRKVKFYTELLYRSLKFNVRETSADYISKPDLDLSGGVINLGIKFSF
jgi:hypothetical protein